MLFLQEIRHRKMNFLFTILGVTVAVSLVVAFYTLTKATWNETRLLTRDMGFNLRIIPSETDMDDFWLNGYAEPLMPESLVQRMVDQHSVNYAHLTASLHRKGILNGQEVIFTGLSPEEIEPGGGRKSKMIFAIPKSKIVMGFEIAQASQLEVGDEITVENKLFIVDRVLAETGSMDDIRLFFDLSELQQLLHLNGFINEIMALNCMCSTEGDNPLAVLREELSRIIPEAKVVMNTTIATAREKQRKMGDSYFALLVPVLVLFCMFWIALTSLANVNQRTHEIGILRALGFSTGRTAGLFFSRAAAAGLLGAIFGFFGGSALANAFGPEIFKVAPESLQILPYLFYWSVFFAPLLACVAAFIPVMWALSRDPTINLNEA